MNPATKYNKTRSSKYLIALCLFFLCFIFSGCGSGSSTTSSTLPTGDVITFSPSVITLNNPTGNVPNSIQQFTLQLTALNSLGQPLIPSAQNPIHINVYGAPNGVISPSSTTTSTESVTFIYNGESFPNNITINAWITDTTNNGAAIGVTQILMQNKPSSCVYGTKSYNVPLESSLPGPLQVLADVGYNQESASAKVVPFIIDTGSLGVMLPESELSSDNLIGPGATGFQYYDSNGYTYSGNYYLAPVSIKLQDGSVIQTHPIMVLGYNKKYCYGPSFLSCYVKGSPPDIHIIGIGFDSVSTLPGALFNSPAYNAFLHITDASNGTDISPGYYITPNDGSTATGLTLGITSTESYSVVDLTQNPYIPGDFYRPPGCYSFTELPVPNQFCTTVILDTGIDFAIIHQFQSQWPNGTYNSKDQVPAGESMAVQIGAYAMPAANYSFVTVESNPPNGSATPELVQWLPATESTQVFFNTGRRLLYSYDYFYDGQCGQVGYFKLP